MGDSLGLWLSLGTLLFAAAAGAGLFFAQSAWHKRRQSKLGFARRVFLTPNEVDFYRRLTEACATDLLVFPQVSMGALIDTQVRRDHPLYWQTRQMFSSKICDFVLCEPRTLVPLMVVELDDKTHDSSQDERRDRLLATAGLETMRFWSRNKPSAAQLRSTLSERLSMLRS